MRKQLAALALALILPLSACSAVPVEDQRPEPSQRLGDIAYVPLDDRPDNWERVEYLAASLGYRLLLPEEGSFRTALNGQPLNPNGTQSGDRAALYEWVLAQEAAGCDRYLLSLDQLLSGGLVNSRAMAEPEDVTLSDGTVLTESELLEKLLTALAADPNNRVYLLESVMRLAPTVGYRHWTLEEYNALRAYGAAPRPAPEALSLAAVEENYPLGADGAALSLTDYGLTAEEVTEYLSARSRKLALSEEMLTLCGALSGGTFRVLVGIDDSSEAESIQKNEIAYLSSLLREGDAILSGVDDLAFKALTRLFLEETGWYGGETPAVRLRCYGGTEDRPACEYDYKPLTEILAEHLAYFGLREAREGEDAAFEVLILTQPEEESRKPEYVDALAAQLRENEAAAVPTALLDAGNGRYDAALQERLLKDCHLGQLLSYSGFLDMAIVTGTALSHAAARYAWLCQWRQDAAADYAFRKTLTASLVLDMGYKHLVRPELLPYVREQGGTPDNFCAGAVSTEELIPWLTKKMDKACAPLLRNLSASNYLTDLSGSLSGWGGVALENWRFPWQRAFEVRMDIRLAAPESAH